MSPYLAKLDGIKEKKVKENYPEKIFTGNLNASKPSSGMTTINSGKAPQKSKQAPAKQAAAAPAAKRNSAPIGMELFIFHLISLNS